MYEIIGGKMRHSEPRFQIGVHFTLSYFILVLNKWHYCNEYFQP